MLAQTLIAATLTATLAIAVAVPAPGASSLTQRDIPHCRPDSQSCDQGHTCAVNDWDGTCTWYYCQGGYMQPWINCGQHACAYQGDQPACQ